MSLFRIGFSIIALSLCASAAFSQDYGFEYALDSPSQKEPWLLDWGGELSSALILSGQELAASLAGGAGAMAWLKLSLPEQWQLYLRAKDNASVRLYPLEDGSFSATNRWELSDATLRLLIRNAPFSLSIGRKRYTLGTGLALSGHGDGVELEIYGKSLTAKAFGFYTGLISPESSRYAMFLPDDALGTKRYFGGYSASTYLREHTVGFLGLYQGYFGSREEEYYTSWYGGAQGKGPLLGGEYLVEMISQRGYSPLGADRGDIRAYAGRISYSRAFDGVSGPHIRLGYAFASGDEDRISAQGPGGNQSGFDEAFQAFGDPDTGIVLRPYFSNLHVAQAGFGASRGRLAIGFNYLYFAKHKKESPINTADATLPNHDLGHELNASLTWSPFLDLSLTLGAGVFLPGRAFASGGAPRYAAIAGFSLVF